MKKSKLSKILCISTMLTLSSGLVAIAGIVDHGWSNGEQVNYSSTYSKLSDCTSVAAKTSWDGVSGYWVVSQVRKSNANGKVNDTAYDRGAHWAYAKADTTLSDGGAWISHSVQAYDQSSKIWEVKGVYNNNGNWTYQ